MKRNHSFTFVTLVNDVILTSGKEISNLCFQVPAVWLTLLTLLTSDLSNWFGNWRQSNTTMRLLKVNDAISFKWWFDDLTARARASLPARQCPPRPVLVKKFSRKFIVFANKVSIRKTIRTLPRQTLCFSIYAFSVPWIVEQGLLHFLIIKGPIDREAEISFSVTFVSLSSKNKNNSTICKFVNIFCFSSLCFTSKSKSKKKYKTRTKLISV